MIYGYSQAFTFSASSAGQTAIAAHAYSHLLPPVSGGDVGDLLGSSASRPTNKVEVEGVIVPFCTEARRGVEV